MTLKMPVEWICYGCSETFPEYVLPWDVDGWTLCDECHADKCNGLGECRHGDGEAKTP